MVLHDVLVDPQIRRCSVCLQEAWDVDVLEGLDDSLGLLSLKLEDPLPFYEAAAERRAGDHVSGEVLKLRPDIHFVRSVRSIRDLALPAIYQLSAARRECRHHALRNTTSVIRHT